MIPPRRVVAATGNAHKLEEMRDLLPGLEIIHPRDAGWSGEVEEDGETLEANALKKALTVARAVGMPALADDTGLFVDALDGAPGVHSARYGGPAQDASVNCAKLLQELTDTPDSARGAEFRCVIALAQPDGATRIWTGTTRGQITHTPRGTAGFGYDSLFAVEGDTRTFAEMSAAEKHRWSHRGRALAAFTLWLNSYSETRS